MKQFINFVKGIVLRGETTDPTDNKPGSIWHNSTLGRLRSYIEGAVREVVSTDQAQTLSNKAIDGATNTLTNVPSSAISSVDRTKITAGTPNHVVTNDGSGNLSSEAALAKIRGGTGIDNTNVTFPSTGVLVTEAATQTLTGKTIDGDDNTVRDLPLNAIKTVIGEANKVVTRDATGALVATKAAPVGAFVGTTDTQTFTNKTIDFDLQDGISNFRLSSIATSLPFANRFLSYNATGQVTATISTPTGAIVGSSDTQTLTGKTIDGDDNTIQDIALASLKTILADANKVIQRDASGIVVAGPLVPTTGTGALVKTDSTDTLTNKTLTAPQIAQLNLLIESATPASPAAGYKKIYPKTDGLVYTLDSSGIELPLAGAGAGGINYITNPSADANTTGWTTYADAAQSTPQDGTGGTPNVTFTRSTTTPLRGTASFILTKDAANRQGQGVSTPFTIDNTDTTKTLTITADYLPGTGYADGDLGVYIYDITNGTIQYPTVSSILNTLVSGKINVTFSATNSTSYRLIMHVQSTSTTAWTMKLDNISVGPVAVPTGNLRGPVGSVIYTGSITPPTGYLYANGAALSRTGYAALFSSIGTTYGVGDGSTTFNIPDLRGIFIRGAGTNATGATSGFSGTLGSYQADQFRSHRHQTGANGELGVTDTRYGNSGAFTANGSRIVSTGGQAYDPWTSSVGGSETNPANVAMAAHICFDAGTVQLSSDNSGRPIVASYTISGATSSSPTQPLNFDVKEVDTTGAVTTGTNWKFTAPESGSYRITQAGVTAAGGFTMFVYKNGINTAVLQSMDTSRFSTGVKILQLVAGDYIDIRPSGAMTTSGASNGIYVSIEKLNPGSQQIAASEKVEASANYAAGAQTITGATITTMVPTTKVYDTHGCYNLATGVFTANRAGRLYVRCFIYTDGNVISTGQPIEINLAKGGSAVKQIAGVRVTNSSPFLELGGTGSWPCVVGDTFTLQIYAGQILNIIGSGQSCWVEYEIR